MENNLREIRETSNLTINDLADMTGLKYQTLRNLEVQDAPPKLDVAYKVAKILDKPVTTIWPNQYKIKKETVTIRTIEAA